MHDVIENEEYFFFLIDIVLFTKELALYVIKTDLL